MNLLAFLFFSFLTGTIAIETAESGAKCGQSPSYQRFGSLYGDQADEGGFHQRIVAGEEAMEQDWPWAAAVLVEVYENDTTDTMHMCTAAVIHKDWILTAAHCVCDGFTETILIGVGSTDVAKQRVYSIEELYVHPKFTMTLLNDDIALLKLNESLEFDEHVQPICLSRSVQVEENEILAAAGWGFTFDYVLRAHEKGAVLDPEAVEDQIRQSDTFNLQEAAVAVRNMTHCETLEVEGVDTVYICVGGLNSGTMPGDSGSALMARRNGSWYHVGNLNSGDESVIGTRIDIVDHSFYTQTAQMCDYIEYTTKGDVKCEL